MNRLLITTTGVSLAFFIAACSSSSTPAPSPSEKGGSSSSNAGGNKSTSAGGSSNTSNTSATNKGGDSGNNSSAQGGSGNSSSNSKPSSSQGGSGQSSVSDNSGGTGNPPGSGSGKGGSGASTPPSSAKGGSGPAAGGASNGQAGKGNTPGGGRNGQGGSSAVTPPPGGGPSTGQGGTPAAAGSGPQPQNKPALVTSAEGAYWKTDGTLTEAASGTADITVSDDAQNWDGWGGAFNEIGWDQIKKLSEADQSVIIKALFSAEGANFNWGRIPIGASDYATSRYTLDDTGTDIDPVAKSDESNRPEKDTALAKFSLERDKQKLIPYIKAAQAVRADIKFWASPWTPPSWMKKGYKTGGNDNTPATLKRASYFDGGNMLSDTAILTAYAEYFKKFVQGYKDLGINVEVVSPQNEPGYEQNYPSCLWDKDTYTKFIGTHLGPAMKELGVKIMLGSMSNNGDEVAGAKRVDPDIAAAVMADSTAKGFVTVAGVQWGVLGAVVDGSATSKFGGLPFWASEHKCGNYPWNPSGYPAYDSSKAPNDMKYAVESWGYIRDAINKAKVTSYNAWNMVLDPSGLGNDTSRDWKQDTLIVVNGGKIVYTPTYYVFRHASQFAEPGGKVAKTTGEAIAYKNTDGSYAVVVYNSGAAKKMTVAIGSKKVQFDAPAAGWATINYKP